MGDPLGKECLRWDRGEGKGKESAEERLDIPYPYSQATKRMKGKGPSTAAEWFQEGASEETLVADQDR
ncbi:hypothetical protein R1flu_011211 [Riccia fluitans]|uniref:Uncharacterized protein n=1 Tax=Riccia fluitans TaxID=41844 RepID=A0ABD1Z9P2_9MARC